MNRYFFVIVISLMVLASCDSKRSQQMQQGPVPYEVITLKNQSKDIESSYTTSIRGKQEIKIFPQISGYLQKIFIDEGSFVKKGQILFIIQQAPFMAAYKTSRANVEVAKANVETAQITYESKKTLYDQKIISEVEFKLSKATLSSAKAQLTSSKAEMDRVKTNRSFTELRSPCDGVVGKITVREGNLVSPTMTQAITEVASTNEMFAYFSLPQSEVVGLISKYGDLEQTINSLPKVSLRLSNGKLYNEKGIIKTISGIVDKRTGAVSVRASFPNSQRVLLSGSNGRVLMNHHFENMIIIPQSATYEIQNKTYVYRVIDGVTKSTIVEVSSINDGRKYIVTKGLKVGEKIIAKGASLVREDTPVQTL
ncbi:efflux RND transporter periplasmic adaptor subunit [Halosquirtibacter xylanolyticus]|uniref:efflux RND transporter periplasmic adaptor subunit n=1 Tax=Halosquirtibacter xylanolyticus TaxID=3374599 RepID=UPI0037490071|nr:efflux RND transporter periplasmic adaptor subunit [Prolixibacteraceae bacterium]